MQFKASLILLSLLAACSSSKESPAGGKAVENKLPSSAPVKAQAVALMECPMDIVPGKSLGQFQIGMTRAELERFDPKVVSTHLDPATKTEFIKAGPYNVRLCADEIEEIWLDDLRLGPDCARYQNKSIARETPRTDFIGLFDNCKDLAPRTGGAFTGCEQGGLRIGYGMGDFLQVRVARPGSDLDDDCSHRLDDGTPVPLDPASLSKMAEELIDTKELSDYWHPTNAGRKPLRIAGADVLGGQPAFNKFGEPVVYVSADKAKSDGQPFFEFTKLSSTQTRASIEFRYAVEGLIGSATYVKRFGTWHRTGFTIAEQ